MLSQCSSSCCDIGTVSGKLCTANISESDKVLDFKIPPASYMQSSHCALFINTDNTFFTLVQHVNKFGSIALMQ